jgi:hypothetical protein
MEPKVPRPEATSEKFRDWNAGFWIIRGVPTIPNNWVQVKRHEIGPKIWEKDSSTELRQDSTASQGSSLCHRNNSARRTAKTDKGSQVLSRFDPAPSQSGRVNNPVLWQTVYVLWGHRHPLRCWSARWEYKVVGEAKGVQIQIRKTFLRPGSRQSEDEVPRWSPLAHHSEAKQNKDRAQGRCQRPRHWIILCSGLRALRPGDRGCWVGSGLVPKADTY